MVVAAAVRVEGLLEGYYPDKADLQVDPDLAEASADQEEHHPDLEGYHRDRGSEAGQVYSGCQACSR